MINSYCWGYVISEMRVALKRSETPYWIGVFLAINPVFTSLGWSIMLPMFILSALDVPNHIRITSSIIFFLVLIANVFRQKEIS